MKPTFKPRMDIGKWKLYSQARENWLRQNPKRTAAMERAAMDDLIRKIMGQPPAGAKD